MQVEEGQPNDLRPLFEGRDFIGTDFREGPGVDRVEDLRSLSFGDGEVGTALCLDTLEHCADPITACREMHRVVADGGVCAISSVMLFGIHGYPSDYWRFTPEGFRTLLEDFDDVGRGRSWATPTARSGSSALATKGRELGLTLVRAADAGCGSRSSGSAPRARSGSAPSATRCASWAECWGASYPRAGAGSAPCERLGRSEALAADSARLRAVPAPGLRQAALEVEALLPAELLADRGRVEHLAVDLAAGRALALDVGLEVLARDPYRASDQLEHRDGLPAADVPGAPAQLGAVERAGHRQVGVDRVLDVDPVPLGRAVRADHGPLALRPAPGRCPARAARSSCRRPRRCWPGG